MADADRCVCCGISIHALRGEGDATNFFYFAVTQISIHALRGEGDTITASLSSTACGFQSTPSVGRATDYIKDTTARVLFQSTPSVGRATFCLPPLKIPDLFQSTPSVGRATSNFRILSNSSTFQSTPSVGRATQKPAPVRFLYPNFNPRPPWGGRQMLSSSFAGAMTFQSTPSVGRATRDFSSDFSGGDNISIHALRGEGDNERSACQNQVQNHFNPRPPWGGRPGFHAGQKGRLQDFNPRPPWGGRLQKYTNMQCYACT